jgi:hypothetical protein
MLKKPLMKLNILHDNSPEESRNRRNIPQHNKGYKLIANDILNGEKLKLFYILIQYNLILSHSNRQKKRDINRKGRS